MNEIYWITRLDAINAVLGISMSVLGFILVACLIASVISFVESDEDIHKSSLKAVKKTIAPFILSMLLFILIPTKKDALLIWGVGGTIDYIKSNETAKQLPDKCIQALDKFVDEYMLNEDKEGKEK